MKINGILVEKNFGGLVVNLLNDIRKKVFAEHNTMLEPEIIVIGEEN